MAQSVAIDALPYYDHGYDEPGVREAAVKLVEEEMQRYRPTKGQAWAFCDFLKNSIFYDFNEIQEFKKEIY